MRQFKLPWVHSVLPITLIVISVMEAAHAGQSHEHVVGEAFGLKDTEFRYRETHCRQESKLATEVVYQLRDGSLIARKSLDYRSGKITPSFIQHNIRANEKIAVSLDRNELAISVKEGESSRQAKSIQVDQDSGLPIVIDAGFDAFIRDNWSNLVAGETLAFRFPLASRSRLVSLRVKPVSCSYETESDQCFKLEPSNWLVRMLAAPIELGYDSKLTRLSRYRGLSNINDDNGKGMVVDIRYRYGAAPGQACKIEPSPSIGQASILIPGQVSSLQ